MCASVGFFAGIGLKRAEKKVTKGKLSIEDLAARYHALSIKLDQQAQAKLFERAVVFMKNNNHPQQAFDFYLLAAQADPSRAASYQKQAVHAHPNHPDAPVIAQVLANDLAAKANDLALLLEQPVPKNGQTNSEYRQQMGEQISKIQEGARLYADAAKLVALFSPDMQAWYLQAAIDTLEGLLKSNYYYGYFPTGGRPIVEGNLNSYRAEISKLNSSSAVLA